MRASQSAVLAAAMNLAILRAASESPAFRQASATRHAQHSVDGKVWVPPPAWTWRSGHRPPCLGPERRQSTTAARRHNARRTKVRAMRRARR